MNISANQPSFHVVDPPYHVCGHYHFQYDACPRGRCGSYLCCVPGDDPTNPNDGNDGAGGEVTRDDDVDADPTQVVYENRAPYGMCARCWTHLPLLGVAGLTACCNQGVVYI